VPLEIYLHFGLEVAVGSVVASILAELRDEIKAKFPPKCAGCDVDELIVQTKDADNKLHPLEDDPNSSLVRCWSAIKKVITMSMWWRCPLWKLQRRDQKSHLNLIQTFCGKPRSFLTFAVLLQQ